jgi:C-terminal processing protease CtpA/Prc
MTADEYAQVQNEAKGNRSGLGLSFTKTDAEELRVSLVCGNSPAEAAGVVAGTYLLGGGASADTIVAFENYDAFSVFLQDYEEGEILYLQTRNGEEERVIEIAKADYVENYVYYRTKDSAYRFTGTNATDMTEGGEVLSALPDDTAYIRLTGFNGSAATQFSKAMEKMREDGKVNLVLDLRTNGGGYMRIFREIAKYFCKTATSATPLVCIADYKKKQENYYATSNVYKEYFSEESRICVLADNGTASASECLLGVMLDYQAISYADICLSQRNGIAKTYGKGIMQTTFFLPFGLDAVKLTTAKMLWPVSGNCIHGIGILPSNGALVVEELPFDDKEIANAIEKLGL